MIKEKTGELTVEYAAWRACAFAISAVTQHEQGKNWLEISKSK